MGRTLGVLSLNALSAMPLISKWMAITIAMAIPHVLSGVWRKVSVSGMRDGANRIRVPRGPNPSPLSLADLLSFLKEMQPHICFTLPEIKGNEY